MKTIALYTESKFKEKGSSFIGKAFPILSIEESTEILEAIKKEHYNATHHCYAYKLIDGSEKYSDDGEPNGTAGIRIMNAIQHFDLTNVLVVVVRYFGGTKLGVGPLGKAYYKSAFETLNTAKIVVKKKYLKFRIKFDYEFISTVHHFLSNYDTQITENIFEEKPGIEFLIVPGELDKLKSELIDSSKGKIEIDDMGSIHYI
ncbi:MAG: YigZ family protein [Melioribacteraceae bacterium]|nr:YigZ family protein [Melioribacteraceae bacterium]MCF8356184.1 YigZ family protein [Melioribacteraceae bacterium]MCF8394755.1 YigZ family protein [Melioribacteraceae bacterium]MCF8417945.1 YigZ family protein [Melioribacteraceae bacterium]